MRHFLPLHTCLLGVYARIFALATHVQQNITDNPQPSTSSITDLAKSTRVSSVINTAMPIAPVILDASKPEEPGLVRGKSDKTIDVKITTGSKKNKKRNAVDDIFDMF